MAELWTKLRRPRYDWWRLALAIVIVPVLYVMPLAAIQAGFASGPFALVMYSIPIATSLTLCILFHWMGFLIGSGANILAIVFMRDLLADQPPGLVGTVLGLVVTLQIAITIITILVNDLRRRVSELQRMNTRLNEIALVDELTGLYNYRCFSLRLEEELEAATRYGRSCALMMLDIDSFKFFNDVQGHRAGDAALQQFGRVLLENCRSSDIVARYGGDEFVIIAPEADEDTARIAADRLRQLIQEEAIGEHPGRSERLTASIGVSVAPLWASSSEQLLEQADLAAYQAKLQGGNEVFLYGEVDGGVAIRNREDIAVLAAVRTLLSIISARDGYTYGHSQRVMRDACAIGRKLGLNADELRTLQWAALMHDLGKVELSQKLLLKRSDLDHEEWKAIQRHPDASARLIEPVIDRMESIADVVRSHHERYDGRGYPRGLQGDQIPRIARVLTVADAIDAMRTDRPYRENLNSVAIRRELERCRGGQFDPEVVDAALKAIEEY